MSINAKLRLITASSFAAALLWATTEVGAQQPQERGRSTTAGVRARGGGADANVTKDEATNVAGKAASQQPEAKTTNRGSFTAVAPGQLCIDSWVDLYVRIYVNGEYVGTVSPWGDSCGYYGPGTFRLYAKAVFTDGSYLSWGPINANLTYGYTWQLNP
jgi:hypothetical protein